MSLDRKWVFYIFRRQIYNNAKGARLLGQRFICRYGPAAEHAGAGSPAGAGLCRIGGPRGRIAG